MLWNLGLHIIAGVFGREIFTWTFEGFMWCIAITAIVQGIDMLRLYSTTVKRIRQQPTHIQDKQMQTFKKRLPVTFPQLFIAKLVGYGLVTLVAAIIGRAI